MAAVGPLSGQGPHPLPAWVQDRPLTGPFISGTNQAVLAFGQDPSEEADGRGGQAARRGGAHKTRSTGGPAGSDTTGAAARAWPVSLADLIGAGLLTPGPDALSVVYKGSTPTAELRPDGTILHEGRVFGSASAFSIHAKRLITPDKQGDDGWKSVLYQGKPLDVYRRQLRETLSEAADDGSEGGMISGAEDEEEGQASEMTSPRAGAPPSAAASSGPGPAVSGTGGAGPATPVTPAAAMRQGADGASSAKPLRTGGKKGSTARTPAGGRAPGSAAAGTGGASRLATMSRAKKGSTGKAASTQQQGDQGTEDLAWVQCDGCGTWRVVPDPGVAAELAGAGDDATWHCRDATWDVTAVPPSTPPCTS